MRSPRGLLDTSVVIDLDNLESEQLPFESLVSTITLAELVAGTHKAPSPIEAARRQTQAQRIEATLTTLPFDANAARVYGLVFAATLAAGRTSRARVADFLIAATAIAACLPLFTRNFEDVKHLESILEIVGV